MLPRYAIAAENLHHDVPLPLRPQIVPRPLKKPPLGDAAVESQLERLLATPALSGSPRLSRFLTYCVKATLEGRASELNQYTIGVDVFDKPSSFDPATDPLVRVEAARLRQKLQIYYAGPGSEDEVLIQFAPKGYQVKFERLERSAVTGGAQPTIAILPFDDLTPDHEEQSFCLGLSIELAVALSAMPGLRVLSRSVVRHHLEMHGDPAAVCRRLGATSTLEGTVRKSNGALRIAIEVTNLADGLLLWAGTFTAQGANPIVIQEEIAAACAKDMTLVT